MNKIFMINVKGEIYQMSNNLRWSYGSLANHVDTVFPK